MPMAYHMRKRIEKATGEQFDGRLMDAQVFNKAVLYLGENFSSILPSDDFTLDNILDKARTLVSRNGIRVIVIDPYNRIEHLIPSHLSETQYIGMVIDKMSNFAYRNNCLIILVAHPRKVNRDPVTQCYAKVSMYDVNGSAHFYNKSDFGLVIERDHLAKVTRVRVEKVKFKHLGSGNNAEAVFVYNLKNGRFACCPQGNIAKAVFDNSSWI